MQLTATFKVTLQSPLVIKGVGQAQTFEVKAEGFNVQVTLVPDLSGRSKLKGERHWSHRCYDLLVSSSRWEEEEPPPPAILPGGGRVLVNQSNYFRQRLPDYGLAAASILKNLLLFFKYTLRQPLVEIVDGSCQEFQNPEWTDGNGKSAGEMGATFIVKPDCGGSGELGSKKFERKHHAALTSELAKPRTVALHEEILSDAQAAACGGNIRRAVLEMAIACEIFVKQAFFEEGSRASLVVEALEDKGVLHLRILQLIEIGGSMAVGTTFSIFDPASFKDVEQLFQARNKIAHRGEPSFRDQHGRLHKVDEKTLRRWWSSLDKLIAWAQPSELRLKSSDRFL